MDENKLKVAINLLRIGGLQERTKQYDEAIDNYSQAIDTFHEACKETPNFPMPILSLSNALASRGKTYASKGDLISAENDLLESLRLITSLCESHPDEEMFNAQSGLIHEKLGIVYLNNDNPENAEKQFELSRSTFKKVYCMSKANENHLERYAISLINLGKTARYKGDLEQAISYSKEAFILFLKLMDLNKQREQSDNFLSMTNDFINNLLKASNKENLTMSLEERISVSRDMSLTNL